MGKGCFLLRTDEGAEEALTEDLSQTREGVARYLLLHEDGDLDFLKLIDRGKNST